MTPSSPSNPKDAELQDSSELQRSVLSKVAEWKPFLQSESFQERRRSERVPGSGQQLSELHEELRRAKEERSRALDEISELKRVCGKSLQNTDKSTLMEVEARKAKESEKKMLESMIHQTKQLEQTKALLSEAKVEIRNLQERIRMVEDMAGISHQSLAYKESLESVGIQQELMQLKDNLRRAMEAEENSKKAMDDLAVALMEVTAETNQAKAELALRESELEKAREEAKSDNLVQFAEQKLLEALDGYDKMILEYKESVAAWMKKEEHLLNCLRISEEVLTKEKEENSRVNMSLSSAKEENIKLRDIVKQAVNEAVMLKEALEIAQKENSSLSNQLLQKENSLKQAKMDYEIVKLSEAAALDSVKELKSLLALTSAIDSRKISNFTDMGSFRQSKGTNHSAKTNRCLKIFPSERWKPDYQQVNNGRRHSVGEPGMYKDSDRDRTNETKKILVSSSSNVSNVGAPLFSYERGTLNLESDTAKENFKKKKTFFRRLGDTLRRRSIHN